MAIGPPAGEVVAHVVRSGHVESVHRGSVVVLDADGRQVAGVGVPAEPVFGRSSNKPLQAAGMLRAGLKLDPPDLALAAASHSGEPAHVERVRAILAAGGLGEDDLACPADLPLDERAAAAWLAGGGQPRPVLMNCSGQHAAMLRTCQAAGWPTAGYTDPDHPLQAALCATMSDLAGERLAALAVDGCGAPAIGVSLRGLAAAYLRLVHADDGQPDRSVADAMRAHPDLVGGTDRPVTELMAGVPGLMAKDGAEGMFAAAMPGVGAVAVKIDDGAGRPRTPVLVAALRRLGVRGEVLDRLAEAPILGGGAPVGCVRSVW
jgi:L-asparaginase II